MYGAWGPRTWGPSPQEEAAALRLERAREEQADGLLSWLGLHPWVWVLGVLFGAFIVLGPWLGLLAPGNSSTLGYLCSSSAGTSRAAAFRLAPGVPAGGLAALTPGEPVALRLDPYGRVIGIGGGDIPGVATVDGTVASVNTVQGVITITESGTALSQCQGGR